MKKILLCVFLIFTIILPLASCNSSAPETPTEAPTEAPSEESNVETNKVLTPYILNPDGKGYTIGLMSELGENEVVIDQYNGLPITGIRERAFANNKNLTSIKIADSVTEIADYAFEGCDNLVSADLGNGVVKIGCYAFSNCSKLAQISIPDSVTDMQSGVFNKCLSLREVSLPEGIKKISSRMFGACSNLSVVNVPQSVIIIENGAFSGCSSLSGVVLPQGLRRIGSYAFENCYGLLDFNIPDSVDSIGAWAFRNSSAAKRIDYVYYVDGWAVGFYKIGGKGKSLVISENIIGIADDAFSGHGGDYFKSITLPNGLLYIGEHAFLGNKAVTQLEIPNTVTHIGANAFSYTGIESLTIPASVVKIGSPYNNEYRYDGIPPLLECNAFITSNSLKSITVDENNPVYYSEGNCVIERSTMMLIAGCADSTPPEGVTEICEYVFSGINGLTEIYVPASVKKFGELAFCESKNLVKINYGGTVEQWHAIEKDINWSTETGEYVVYCTDGEIAKADSGEWVSVCGNS